MENKLTKLIEPELKAFNAITKGCENVLKKAGVADRMLITLATDKAPAVLVAVPDEISQKQFVHSIRDLLITHCDGDEEKITKTLLEIVDEFDNPSVMMKLK